MVPQHGFTLIELLITITIMSIMMVIGVPNFQSLITGSRLTSAANSMVSALQLARSEALKQHKSVVVTKNTTWGNGWNVFVDLNSNNIQNTNEPTFSTFDALSSIITVFTPTKYKNYVRYDESGRINTNGTFSFCSPAGTNQDFRSVVIANTGRIHIESATSTPSSTYTDDCK